MAESLAEFFLANFGAHGDERAYGRRRGYRMEWRSYAEVRDAGLCFACELQARNIGKGDRVMLWGENSAEWVAAFFGCTVAGAVVVPMDSGASADFAMRVFQQVEAKLLVCSRKHAELSISGQLGSSTIILEDLTQTLRHHSADAISNVAIGRDDILQIVFTSGTTAEPKGVVLTHRNVLANLTPLETEMKKYLKYERWVHPVRFLNLLPLSHVFGQFLGMFSPPLLGGTVIFQEELKPSEIVSTIKHNRVSVLVSVPRVLQSLKQKFERDLEDDGRLEHFRRRFHAADGQHFLRRWWTFRSIHRQFGWKFWAFISGGAALDSDTEEFWGRLGYAAIQGYGLTETTSLISVNHPFKLGKHSIGKALPGREIKLAEDGEILVRGGGVAAGYWETGQVRSVANAEGWYGTGDIGELDDAGNLYFKGRKKNVIVTPAGLNIYPEDLETALWQQPGVRECVVVGIDCEGNAEPCAVLILRDGAKPEEAVEQANKSLAEFQRMRLWIEWPQGDFPRTSTQKLRRNLISEFAAERLHPSDKDVRHDSPVAELIGRITRRTVSSLDPGASLDSDLGLSSLDRVELISALEDRYQVDLSEAPLSAAHTLGDVEKMLRGKAGQRRRYHYPSWVLSWPATWVRWLAHYLLMRPAMMLLGWPRIQGRGNLRGWNGPLLVVCNHISDVDVGFVQTALPVRLRHRIATATGGEALEALRTPAPGTGFFRRVYDHAQWILGVSLLNLFPLPREAGFRQSFAYAGQAVDLGYSVLVFPEGRHTADGKMNPFRAGIGLLAKNLDIPVLPMKIVGLYEVKQARRKFAGPWKISVRIGKPIKFAVGAAPQEIARELQHAVEVM